MKMKLHNTLTRKKEDVIPIEAGKISLYTCGPTVYNFAHIGNFRCYVFEDLLRRTLKYAGFKVTHVMNITDIDDKTLAGAIHEKMTLREYTDPYTEAFFKDLETLNVEKAEHYPRATDFIPQMCELIQKLLDRKIAYRGGDESIYFSIKEFPQYGCLSHLQLDELKAGASERVGTDEYTKENVADFVLWKAYDPKRDGEIYWESPFGKGRPGWHIECSAMAMSLLGETIDIHVGGVDNMFPHHENEIAQSQGCTGKQFVKMWLHCEHLLVGNKKMSKSLGNFYTLRDLLEKGYTGPEVRYMLISGHYRSQFNFTFEGLDAARTTLTRLSDFVARLRGASESEEDEGVETIIKETRQGIKEALFDDLNISQAFGELFEMVRKVNHLFDQKKVGTEGAKLVLAFLEEIEQVFGCIPLKEKALEVPTHLLEALKKREEARKVKDFATADAQRDLLLEHGYLIEDTPNGPKLKKK